MKKLLICGAVLAAATLSASALALDRGNVSQKGSLVIFPKINVYNENTTIVRLTNDYFKDVTVKCYWQNGTKFLRDFEFVLTKYQPAWFNAKTGEGTVQVAPFPAGEIGPYPETTVANAPYVGELKCWAVSNDGTGEIRWNHLAGTATVLELDGNGEDTAYEYSSWNFRCLVGANGQACEDAAAASGPGHLALNGVEYEYCPKKLIGQFSPRGSTLPVGEDTLYFNGTDLTIATCNQNLKQDRRLHFTKLKFNVWNEQEVKYTGAYQCIDSWHETFLNNIENNADNFLYDSLRTESARYKVKAMKSSVCPGSQDAGIVGLQVTYLDDAAEDNPLDSGASVAVTHNMLGQFPGFVRYDPQQEVEERPNQ